MKLVSVAPKRDPYRLYKTANIDTKNNRVIIELHEHYLVDASLVPINLIEADCEIHTKLSQFHDFEHIITIVAEKEYTRKTKFVQVKIIGVPSVYIKEVGETYIIFKYDELVDRDIKLTQDNLSIG